MLQTFLSRYPDAEQKRLKAHFQRLSFAAGTLLFSRGDATTEVYFVESGAVKSVNHSAGGKAVYFYTYEDGDCFGYFAGLTDARRTADMICETDCVLWRCDAATFLALVCDQPDNARIMMRRLAGLLRKDTDRITAISGSDAASRLLLYLKEACEAQSSDTIDVPGRDDWASYLNLTRESLSREINALIKTGVIKKIGRSKIEILTKSALESR